MLKNKIWVEWVSKFLWLDGNGDILRSVEFHFGFSYYRNNVKLAVDCDYTQVIIVLIKIYIFYTGIYSLTSQVFLSQCISTIYFQVLPQLLIKNIDIGL